MCYTTFCNTGITGNILYFHIHVVGEWTTLLLVVEIVHVVPDLLQQSDYRKYSFFSISVRSRVSTLTLDIVLVQSIICYITFCSTYITGNTLYFPISGEGDGNNPPPCSTIEIDWAVLIMWYTTFCNTVITGFSLFFPLMLRRRVTTLHHAINIVLGQYIMWYATFCNLLQHVNYKKYSLLPHKCWGGG